MSGMTLFEQVEFFQGYLAAYHQSPIDPFRPPAWQRGYDFHRICGGVEPRMVMVMLEQQKLSAAQLAETIRQQVEAQERYRAEQVEYYRQKAAYEKEQAKIRRRERARERERKASLQERDRAEQERDRVRGRVVWPWLEEIFTLPRASWGDREKLVLRRLAEGYTVAELARRYDIAPIFMQRLKDKALDRLRHLCRLHQLDSPDPLTEGVRLEFNEHNNSYDKTPKRS